MGRTVGDRYEIQSRIGKGGMAKVYRATDKRLLRDIAVKILSGEPDKEGLFYFHREARAIAALRHPNIVQIYDYSGPDEAPAFIVMELIKGGNVDQMLMVKHPLPEAVIYATIQGIASALQHAHDHGVIHRDIKPANVMVEESGRVLLTDFGVAKAYDDALKLGETVAGQQTQLFGTPDFMAPEQVLEEKLGPHTDVFSLGSLIYCLGTNYSPFDDADTVDILRRLVDIEYMPLRKIRPDLSVELESLVTRCLQLKTSQRPSAGEVASICEQRLLDLRIPNADRLVAQFVSGESGGGASQFAPEETPTVGDWDTGTDVDPRPAPLPTQDGQDDTWNEGHTEISTSHAKLTSHVKRPQKKKAKQKAAAKNAHISAKPQTSKARKSTAPHKKRLVWPWVVAGVMFASTLSVVWWLGSRKPAHEPPAEPTAEVKKTEVPDSLPPPEDPHTPKNGPEPSDDSPEPPATPAKTTESGSATEDPAKRRTKRRRREDESASPGQIAIRVKPWGTVYLDGKKQGNTPMIRVLRVSAGAHTVSVTHPGLGKMTKKTQVKSGERVVLTFNLR